MTDRRRRRQTSLSDEESESEESEKPKAITRRPKESECESEGFVADDTSEYESVSGETVEGETETETETEEETEADEDEFDDEDIIIDENFGGLGQERQSGDGEETPDQKDLDDDEDRKNPAFVPRKGAFYEHDLRIGEDTEKEEEPTDDKPQKKLWKDDGKWVHDMYRESEQGPKTRAELTTLYGYDIQSRDKPPDAPPSRFKQREDARNRKNRLSDFIPNEGPNRPPQHRAPRPKSDYENEDMFQGRSPPRNKERPSPPSFAGDRPPFRQPPPQRREEAPAPSQPFRGQEVDSANFPELPRNTEFNNKPRNREFGDRPRNREFDNKPRNMEFNDVPRNRDFDDRPKNRDFNDRPKNRDFADKPKNRDFDDKPRNREFDYNDRPRNRGFDAPNRGGGGGDGGRGRGRGGGGFGPPPPLSSSGRPRNDYSEFKHPQQQKWPHGNDQPMPYRQPPPPVSQANRSRSMPEQSKPDNTNIQNRPSQRPVPSMTVTNSRSFTNSSFRQIDTSVKTEYDDEEFDSSEEAISRNAATDRFTPSSRSDLNRNNAHVNVEYEKKEKVSDDTNIVITVINAPNTSRKSYSRDRRTKVGQTRYNPDIIDENKMTVAESIQRSENRQEPGQKQFRPATQTDAPPPQQHYSQQQHQQQQQQQHAQQQSPPKPTQQQQQQQQQRMSYPPQSAPPSQPQKVTPKLNLSRPPNRQMIDPSSNDLPDIAYEHQQQIFNEQERQLQHGHVQEQPQTQYHENPPQPLRGNQEFQQQRYHEKPQQQLQQQQPQQQRQQQHYRDIPQQQYLERQQHQQQQQQYREKQLEQQHQYRDQQHQQQPQQYRDKQQQYEQKQQQQYHEPPHAQRDHDNKAYPQSSLPPRLESAAQNRTKRYSTQRQRPMPDSNYSEQVPVEVKTAVPQPAYYTQAGYSPPIFHPHLSNAAGAIHPSHQMPPKTAVTASAPSLDRVPPSSQQPIPRQHPPQQQQLPRQQLPRQQLPRQQQPRQHQQPPHQTVVPPVSVAPPSAPSGQHVFQPRILPPPVQYAVPVSSAALQNAPRLVASIPSPVLIPAVVGRPRQPPPPLLAPQFNMIPYAPAAATTQTPLIYGGSLPQAPPPPLPPAAVFHPVAPIPSSPTTSTPAQPAVPRYPSPTTVDQAKEVIRGGTTYYPPELQRSPSQTSEGVAKEMYRGGTIFYMADVHQPQQSPREPVRRVKSAIPIVNPQDITHERGRDEGSYTDEEGSSNFSENEGAQYPHSPDYSPNARSERAFEYEYEGRDVVDGIDVNEKSEFEPGYDSQDEFEPEVKVKREVNPEYELQDEVEPDNHARSDLVEPGYEDLQDEVEPDNHARSDLVEPGYEDLQDEVEPDNHARSDLVEPGYEDLQDEVEPDNRARSDLVEPGYEDLQDEVEPDNHARSDLVEPGYEDLQDEVEPDNRARSDLVEPGYVDLQDDLDSEHHGKTELEPETDLHAHDELEYEHRVKAEFEPENDLHSELENEDEAAIGGNYERNDNENVYSNLEEESEILEPGDRLTVNDFDDDFEPESGSDCDTPTYGHGKHTDLNVVGERLSDIVDNFQERGSSELKRDSRSPSVDQVVTYNVPVVPDVSKDDIESDITDASLTESKLAHLTVVNSQNELTSDVANAGLTDTQLESDSRITELVYKDISDLVERVRFERETENNSCKAESDMCNTEPDACKAEPELDKAESNLCENDFELCKSEQDLCSQETVLCKIDSDLSETDTPTSELVTIVTDTT